ncbi:MAG: hypothetical protein JWM95_2718 [Gemmatimonadetes bacterium]|nr:hypothetical protein [Gemmatimonadota bacterium]
MTKRVRISILSLATAVLLAGCGEQTTAALAACEHSTASAQGLACETPHTSADSVVARARWTANRPASYDFILTLNCFCGPEVRRPVLITVTGTTVTSRTYVDDGTPLATQFAGAFPSIDGLFDLLDDAKRRNAARADAVYDGVAGYLLQLSLDYQATVADDESTYVVSAFRTR